MSPRDAWHPTWEDWGPVMDFSGSPKELVKLLLWHMNRAVVGLELWLWEAPHSGCSFAVMRLFPLWHHSAHLYKKAFFVMKTNRASSVWTYRRTAGAQSNSVFVLEWTFPSSWVPPSCTLWGFQFHHLFTQTCFFVFMLRTILGSVESSLTELLIGSPWMINDPELLFRC